MGYSENQTITNDFYMPVNMKGMKTKQVVHSFNFSFIIHTCIPSAQNLMPNHCIDFLRHSTPPPNYLVFVCSFYKLVDDFHCSICTADHQTCSKYIPV